MKHRNPLHWLAAALLATVAFSASAQSTVVSAGVEVNSERAATSERKDELNEHRCLRHTGSLIATRGYRNSGKRCVPASGRVWTRDDLNRTGRADVADALRALDPSVY